MALSRATEGAQPGDGARSAGRRRAVALGHTQVVDDLVARLAPVVRLGLAGELGDLLDHHGRVAGDDGSAFGSALQKTAHLPHEATSLLAQLADLFRLKDHEFLVVGAVTVLEDAVIEAPPGGVEPPSANDLTM
jgi:hypothetical protein